MMNPVRSMIVGPIFIVVVFSSYFEVKNEMECHIGVGVTISHCLSLSCSSLFLFKLTVDRSLSSLLARQMGITL